MDRLLDDAGHQVVPEEHHRARRHGHPPADAELDEPVLRVPGAGPRPWPPRPVPGRGHGGTPVADGPVRLPGGRPGERREVGAGAVEVDRPVGLPALEVVADQPDPPRARCPATPPTVWSSRTDGRSHAAATAGSATASVTTRAPARKRSITSSGGRTPTWCHARPPSGSAFPPRASRSPRVWPGPVPGIGRRRSGPATGRSRGRAPGATNRDGAARRIPVRGRGGPGRWRRGRGGDARRTTHCPCVAAGRR